MKALIKMISEEVKIIPELNENFNFNLSPLSCYCLLNYFELPARLKTYCETHTISNWKWSFRPQDVWSTPRTNWKNFIIPQIFLNPMRQSEWSDALLPNGQDEQELLYRTNDALILVLHFKMENTSLKIIMEFNKSWEFGVHRVRNQSIHDWWCLAKFNGPSLKLPFRILKCIK